MAAVLSSPVVVATLGAACALSACTYDFDKFTEPGAGDQGSGGSASTSSSSGGSSASSQTSSTGLGGSSNATSSGTGGASSSSSTATSTTGATGTGGTASSTAVGGASSTGTGGATGTGGSGGSGGTTTIGTGGSGGSSGGECETLAGTVFDGSCYVVIGTGLNWEGARQACEDLAAGGHLVDIQSAAEQAFLEQLLTPAASDLWIGLALANTSSDPDATCRNDPASCPFLWSDGSEPNYTNWAKHSATDQEPNYTGACVRMLLEDFTWADFACASGNSLLPAICEF